MPDVTPFPDPVLLDAVQERAQAAIDAHDPFLMRRDHSVWVIAISILMKSVVYEVHDDGTETTFEFSISAAEAINRAGPDVRRLRADVRARRRRASVRLHPHRIKRVAPRAAPRARASRGRRTAAVSIARGSPRRDDDPDHERVDRRLLGGAR